MIDNGRVTWAFAAWLWLQSHGRAVKSVDLERRLRCGQRNARRILAQLEEIGLVTRDGDGRNTRWSAVVGRSALSIVLEAADRC